MTPKYWFGAFVILMLYAIVGALDSEAENTTQRIVVERNAQIAAQSAPVSVPLVLSAYK
jgi:hypothetical protein